MTQNLEPKQLKEWARQELDNQASHFLDYCKEVNHEATDMVSYTEFLTLKEEFES